MITVQNQQYGRRRGLGTALVLVGAIVAAIVINAIIAWVATAFGAPAGYGPLSLPAQALFTIIGVVVGWVGWRLISARARDPRRVLRILVPLVVAVSLIPDLLLLAFPIIPGSTPAAVIALMLMHLVVAACAVSAYVLASREVRSPQR
jgi:hypothetical protein